tara:strand:- start:799 stop:1272 length:474 start_codon:yes stop_codon:yes gene_type:complete
MKHMEESEIDARDLAGEVVEDEPDNFDRHVRQQRNRITETVYHIYDVRDGSELFDPLPDGVSYVTAIHGTGEWVGHKTRKEAVAALHPYAKWSETEMRLMEVKGIIDRLTLVASKCLEGFLEPERLSEVAEMLLEEASEKEKELLPNKNEEASEEEE